jgi:hypothetical protein
VVGLVVGQVELEQVQTTVDGIDETDLARQGMNGASTATGDAARTVGDLVMDMAGGEQGTLTVPGVRLVEATLDAALAVVQLTSYLRFHSKSLLA